MKLMLGDCLELLKTLPDNSVDSIVTDPPYGLGKEPDALKMLTDWIETGHHGVKGRGFMGKEWDAFVPQPQVWHECLRVLKPGGHLLAFAGTRTQDLMTLGLRLAGFEIRDMVAWVYAQGFPKSLDVSKALDKMAGSIGENILDLKREIRRRYEAGGMTLKQFNDSCGFEASGYLRENSTWANVLPPAEKWAQIKRVIKCDGELDHLFAAAEREVTGYQKRGNSLNTNFMSGGNDITAPATDAAKQWDGWGTALKPALEPITLARKPLEGTVASNVLKWHTGALNIDGCRVGVEGGTAKGSKPQGEGHGIYGAGLHGACEITQLDKGRWPANLIHDGSDEVVELFPNTKSGKAAAGGHKRTAENMAKGSDIYGGGKGIAGTSSTDDAGTLYGDSGSAARFFYCAKTSKKDRDEGLDSSRTVKHATGLCKEENMALAGSLQKVMCESTVSWGIDESGGSITGLCPLDSLSTILTAIRGITTSQICSLWMPSLTKESTAGVKSSTTNGGSHAENVEKSKEYQQTTTSENQVGSAHGASNVVSIMLSSISDVENWKPATNFHATVKPTDLMRYLCRLVTPPGGIVLDPYMGSGSTGKAASKEGFDFIGIERDPDYFKIAQARILGDDAFTFE